MSIIPLFNASDDVNRSTFTVFFNATVTEFKVSLLCVLVNELYLHNVTLRIKHHLSRTGLVGDGVSQA